MDMIQDWMIINKIKMGDPDAWDILVHKYYDSVYFYCVRRCYGDCDIASDLTQDIFLKLVESLPRYRFIGKFQNYLYTMAVNTCNNYLKKRHIEQIELTDNFTTDLDTSLIDEILHDERKETVQKALDLLPEIQREVVILRYYHDLKVKDSNVLHFHISDNRIDIVGNQGCLTVIHRHAPFFLPIRGNKIIQKS